MGGINYRIGYRDYRVVVMNSLEIKQGILDCVEAIMEDTFELRYMMKGIKLIRDYENEVHELADYVENKIAYYRDQLNNIQELLEDDEEEDEPNDD